MSVKNFLILTALLAGFGFNLVTAASSSAEAEKVLAQAEASLGKARAAGNSWTTTEKLMAAARQVQDQAEAMELARRALLTADRAREQQQLEQDTWQARVPAK